MKNNRKIRTIVSKARKQIVEDAKRLYPGPNYRVTTDLNTVYVDRIFKDDSEEIVVIFDIDAW